MSLLSNTSDNWKYFELLCQNVKFSELFKITFLIRRTLLFHIQHFFSTARFRITKKLTHLICTPNSDKYEDIFSSLPCLSFCAILDWECLWSLFQFSAQIANLPVLLPAFVFFEEVKRDSSEMELRWIASSPLLSGFMQMDLSLGSPSGRRCLSVLLLQIQRHPSCLSSQNNLGCPCSGGI